MKSRRPVPNTRKIGPTTGQLVDKILAVSHENFPSEARDAARTFLADSLLVGMAGTCNPGSAKVLQVAKAWDGGRIGDCRVLGPSGAKLSPHSAAVANGFQIHCLEWDALHEPSVVIALCVNTAALIAETEARTASLDDVLLALAIGVEVAVFFGAASASQPKFFRPSTAGLMGAATALGILRGFDRAQMTNLLGLAYSQVSGTMQAHWEGSETLPLQVGIAARAALTAADLAEAGVDAPHDVVDGKFGYFTLIEEGAYLPPFLTSLFDPWKILEVAHKPFPAGRATQASLTAIMDFREKHDFAMSDVAEFEVHVPPLIKLLVGRPWHAKMSPAYGRLCLEFVVPEMIRNGRIDPGRFTAAHFATEQAAQDASRISVVLDDNQDPNALWPQSMKLELKDGRSFKTDITVPFGSPGRPMSAKAQRDKACFCFEIAGLPDRSDEIFAIGKEAGTQASLQDMLNLVTSSETAG